MGVPRLQDIFGETNLTHGELERFEINRGCPGK